MRTTHATSKTRPLHLGIIVSMKAGLGQFIYREICGLQERGARISLFPAKHRPGLYNPRPEWDVCYWQAWRVVLSQPLRFLWMPLRYLSVLWQAVRYGAVADFMLAAYFAPRMQDVDVIYSTFGDRKLFIGYFNKLLIDKPLAVELHADELYRSPNPRLFRVALDACDRIIAVTQYNRDLLRDRYGIAPERVEVVRLFVDLREYKPERKFIILIVAFFAERKGHETLFRAIKELGRDDVEVWVVGDGGAEQEAVDVPKLAAELGVASQVAFFGALSGTALRAVYRACDVFCLPCRHDRHGCAEGFPTVLIEAMASGKPVVTTRHVEIPRIVEQIIVEENDVDGLAAALERVYSSATLRDRLGDRNRELAETHFSPENVARTMEVLCEIAGSASDLRRTSSNETCDAAQTSSDAAAQHTPIIDPQADVAPKSVREPSGAAP